MTQRDPTYELLICKFLSSLIYYANPEYASA